MHFLILLGVVAIFALIARERHNIRAARTAELQGVADSLGLQLVRHTYIDQALTEDTWPGRIIGATFTHHLLHRHRKGYQVTLFDYDVSTRNNPYHQTISMAQQLKRNRKRACTSKTP